MQNAHTTSSSQQQDEEFHLVVSKKGGGRRAFRGGMNSNNNKFRNNKKQGTSEKSNEGARKESSSGKKTVATQMPSAQVVVRSSDNNKQAATAIAGSYSAAVISSSPTLAHSSTTNVASSQKTSPTFYASHTTSNRHSKPQGDNRKKKDFNKPSSAHSTQVEEKREKVISSSKRNEKNQQVVARRGGAKTTAQFFIIRKPLNQEMINYSQSNSLKPIIPNEPEDEMGKSFYKCLKSFVEDEKAHVFDFSNTLNLAQRKRVHSLAEEFNLDHFSRGSNPFRYICVSKRNLKMRDEFQYFGYIGLFGHSIDELVKKYNINPDMSDNQPLLQKRIKRDGPIHHITLMTRPEINTALKNLESSRELEHLFNENQKQILKQGSEEEKIEILMHAISKVVTNDYHAIGLGKVSQEESAHMNDVLALPSSQSSNDQKQKNDAYFVIIDWPSAQRLRATLGLEPYHFHITVAYKYGDIHGVVKDRSTIVPKESVFEISDEYIARKELEMASFLKYLNVDPRYAHTFISLGWYNLGCLDVLTRDKMDLNDIGVLEEDQQKILSFLKDFSNNLKKYKTLSGK
ncbi:hypothetical protein C9374_007379 [Naegleria lovaniensis]|uniref:R3H domain-containing protein n=1 Tax=Naegleria lovaniensis TaxID=51637 RepID=A0AA88KH60_NAELO|nr:uncharacterized protein C9374_007379 [Naegleria lovaniensis]KAG2379240.1 hypothetical protein C9374_007379 [Naegleria lovaniensis]